MAVVWLALTRELAAARYFATQVFLYFSCLLTETLTTHPALGMREVGALNHDIAAHCSIVVLQYAAAVVSHLSLDFCHFSPTIYTFKLGLAKF